MSVEGDRRGHPETVPVQADADTGPAAAVPPEPTIVVEPPSPDVVVTIEDSHLPGEHRGGFARLPTGPVDLSGPITMPVSSWSPPPAPPPAVLSSWALALSVLGLIASMFVGWALPLGIAAVVVSVMALRRPRENRRMAVWAMVLGIVSVLYSTGWLAVALILTNPAG